MYFNEDRVCEAIIQYIEEREKARRVNPSRPEKEQHSAPIDFAWEIADKTYALEHTGIEPFEHYVRLKAEYNFHFKPICDRLSGCLPPQVFQLHVPAKAMQGLNRRETGIIQDSIVAWVKDVACSLPIKRYSDYANAQPTQLPRVPFPLTLYRFHCVFEGYLRNLYVCNIVTEDLNEARKSRIRRAYEDKIGKLYKWKCRGARTILVFEENDIFFTNHIVVADALLPMIQGCARRPDEIYLMSTCVTPWTMWPLVVDSKYLHDFPQPAYSTIDPSGL